MGKGDSSGIESQCSDVEESCDDLTRVVGGGRKNIRDLRERSAVAPSSCILLNNKGEGKSSPVPKESSRLQVPKYYSSNLSVGKV